MKVLNTFLKPETCFILTFLPSQIFTFHLFTFSVTRNVYSSLKIKYLSSKSVDEVRRATRERKWGRNMGKEQHRWCHLDHCQYSVKIETWKMIWRKSRSNGIKAVEIKDFFLFDQLDWSRNRGTMGIRTKM